MPDWLEEADLSQIQGKFETGELTAEELVWHYFDRIAALAGLRAVCEVNPDAPSIAAALDRERSEGRVRGPLHGIPVLLKDNIDTADRLHTTAGSLAISDHVAARDSHVAARLRRAGAVILGKASMTEWANFMTDGMPSGYSSRVGQVKNAYGPFDPGGSSSGSGVSVSTNLTMLAIGTETSGSILNPASQNSVVGVKPTIGLVSRSGIVPISHSQDTAGPIARTVRDAAQLLWAIAGRDRRDPSTWSADVPAPPQFRLDALRGRRIGVPRKGFTEDLPAAEASVFNEALGMMRGIGAEVLDPFEIPTAEAEWTLDVLIHEFKADLNAYLRTVRPDLGVRNLHELVAFNERHRRQMLRYGQSLLVAAEATSGALIEADYLQSRRNDLRWSREEGIDAVLAQGRLDALVFPSSYGADIAARAGYPSVCVPAGYTQQGEPVGLTLTGPAFSEARLLEFAHAFEQATLLRRPPAAR
ncbi:MAG: amidase family protein [Thermaerobacter sp.]|nr:amidase family protein [Thermaerobacter sp.]